MYDLPELIGKVVTVRASDNEFIATLTGTNEDKSIITLSKPQLVYVTETGVSLVPFALTADIDTVHMRTNTVLAVLPAMEASAEDYLNAVGK